MKYWIVGCGVGAFACYTDEREANEMIAILNHAFPSKYMLLKSYGGVAA